MSKLFRAVYNWFRAFFVAITEKASDPVRDGKFAIEDSKEEIRDLQQQIVKLKTEIKKLERRYEGKMKEVEKMAMLATAVAKQDDVAKARTALEKKAVAQAAANGFQQEILKSRKILEQLEKTCEDAKLKISKAESNFTQFAARAEGAKVRKDIAEAFSTFGQKDSALSRLNELEEQVMQQECEAEAAEEMMVDSTELDEEIILCSKDIDEELEILMKSNSKKEPTSEFEELIILNERKEK